MSKGWVSKYFQEETKPNLPVCRDGATAVAVDVAAVSASPDFA